MRSNKRLLLVLLLLAALVIAACGGGDGDEDETPTEPAAVETEEEVEVTEEAELEVTEEVESTPEMDMTEEAGMEAQGVDETPEAEMEATEEMVMEETPEVEATEMVEMTPEVEMTEEAGEGDVVETATESDFTVLVSAIEAAGLTETLQGPGPFTVFAPTDAAFEALPEGVLELLMSSPISVQSVLGYHVVEGIVTSEDLAGMDGEEVDTTLGSPLTVSVVDGAVVLNGTVNVIQADVTASNGIIHVIDSILLPEEAMAFMGGEQPGMEATEEMEATPEMEMTEEASMEETPEAEATEEMVVEATEEAEMTGEMVAISSACLVTDQGGVNDGTFNELAANAINQAAEDYGIEISVIESSTPTDFEPNINTCLDSGAGAIVTVGFLLADATLAAAEANPDVYFIGVDQFFEGHPDNLVGLQFREDQSGFLAGVLAALMSESGTIGGVYGAEIPPVIKFRHGYEQGARYINPEITTLGSYIDSFIDPAAGQELAEALIGEGADIIFGAGGATGSGGIAYAAAEGILVIGVDQDEYFTTFGGGESPGAENIISSAVKRVDVGVYNMLTALVDGSIEWQGGSLYILDATNDGVGLAPSHDAEVPQEVLDQVNEIAAMLADGSLDTGVDGVTGELLTPIGETEEASTEETTEETEPEMLSILDTAYADGNFVTLLAAVNAADLNDALEGEGPFTVFAPTNDAFTALLDSMGLTVGDLLTDTETLTNVLLYHVVEGNVLAEDVVGMDGQTVTTLSGEDVTISVVDGGVVLNGSVNVTATDIMASNGVIHVIDGVLLPPSMSMEAAPEMEATEEMVMEATPEAEATEEMVMEATEEAEEMTGEMVAISSACLVTDQGGVNDGTFNELAANAINQAAEDFGIEISIIESSTPTDFEPNINTCLDSGAGAIVTVGFLLADATLAAAEANPGVYFIGVDQFFEGHPDNLVGLQFREDQSGFLAGALAALMSESGTIGGVYGAEIPPVIKFRNGYEQGARYVNAEITTLGSYIDSFIDPAAGQELAEALIGEGADIIFGAGGATGSGGIAYAAAEGILVIGVDQDEYFTTFGGGESPGAENIISSAVKRVDVGVYNMLAALVDGSVEWQGGGLYILDATNDGVGLAPSHDAEVPQEVLDAVAAIEAMLADGSLSTGVDGVTGELLESE